VKKVIITKTNPSLYFIFLKFSIEKILNKAQNKKDPMVLNPTGLAGEF